MNNFGKNLKRLREGKGITQSQLAELAGTGEKYISQIESGKVPGGKVIGKLCRALECSEAELRGDKAPDSTEGLSPAKKFLIDYLKKVGSDLPEMTDEQAVDYATALMKIDREQQ